MTTSDDVDIAQARRIAREYVGVPAELVPCGARPAGIYWPSAEDEFWLVVLRIPCRTVGNSEVIAVSKITGVVRWAGRTGE